MDLFQAIERQAEELAGRIKAGQRAAIFGEGGKTRLLNAIARHLGEAVVVPVSRMLDGQQHFLLTAAAQCDAGSSGLIAEKLKSSGNTQDALAALASVLGERRLLVDDASELSHQTDEWGLHRIYGPGNRGFKEWLTERAVAVSSRERNGANGSWVQVAPLEGAHTIDDPLWKLTKGDVRRYMLAASRQKITGPESVDDLLQYDSRTIALDIWERLTGDLLNTVRLLAVHKRPIDRQLLDYLSLVNSDAVDTAIDVGLLAHERGLVWVPRLLQWHWRGRLSDSDRRCIHRQLGESLERAANNEGLGKRHLAILEAHRHFSSIPDLDRAQQCAEFGVGLLLDASRNQSHEKQWEEAARGYKVVLDLAARFPDSDSGLHNRIRGYAVHYLHYNRYHAKLEGPEETLGGYRRSLGLWPENALFWSRTLRCCFVAGRYRDGLRVKHEAYSAVPSHPRRDDTLVVRTVDKLCQRGLLIPSILVWDNYQARALNAKYVERRLHAALQEGAKTRVLLAEDVPSVWFRREIAFSIARVPDGSFLCEVSQDNVLETNAAGDTPIAALKSCLVALWDTLLSLAELPEDGQIEELKQLLDLNRLAIDEDDRCRWLAYLVGLDGQVAENTISPQQLQAIRQTWAAVRRRHPSIRFPIAGRTDEGLCYLAWSTSSLKAATFSVEIDKDGKLFWFYRNRDADECDGTEDEPEDRLPESALDRLGAWNAD